MKIEQEIRRYDCFDLQGIIWHHGSTCNTGHYTADVKVDNIWYSANDTCVKESATFECKSDGNVAPYIVVYKKRNAQIVPYQTVRESVEGLDRDNSSSAKKKKIRGSGNYCN